MSAFSGDTVIQMICAAILCGCASESGALLVNTRLAFIPTHSYFQHSTGVS